MPATKYPSRADLAAFLKKNCIGKKAAAKALGVTRVTLWSWLEGKSVPSDKARIDIETWTKAEVLASGWEPVVDRRKDPRDVTPFEPPVSGPEEPPESEPKPKDGKDAA